MQQSLHRDGCYAAHKKRNNLYWIGVWCGSDEGVNRQSGMAEPNGHHHVPNDAWIVCAEVPTSVHK